MSQLIPVAFLSIQPGFNHISSIFFCENHECVNLLSLVLINSASIVNIGKIVTTIWHVLGIAK